MYFNIAKQLASVNRDPKFKAMALEFDKPEILMQLGLKPNGERNSGGLNKIDTPLFNFYSYFDLYTEETARILSKINQTPMDVVELFNIPTWTYFGSNAVFDLLTVNLNNNRDFLDTVKWVSRLNPFLEMLIEDTKNFLLTGKRVYPLPMVRMYMQDSYRYQKENGWDLPSIPTYVVRPLSKKKLCVKSRHELITLWMSHPNGIRDFVDFYRLFF